METGLKRPVPVFDPAKGLLHNDHFQIGYVTGDIAAAEEKIAVQQTQLQETDLQIEAMIAAILRRIRKRMQTSFVRLADVLVTSAELTLRLRQDAIVAPARLDSTFDSCHVLFSGSDYLLDM